jgi:hypothetical protein
MNYVHVGEGLLHQRILIRCISTRPYNRGKHYMIRLENPASDLVCSCLFSIELSGPFTDIKYFMSPGKGFIPLPLQGPLLCPDGRQIDDSYHCDVN